MSGPLRLEVLVGDRHYTVRDIERASVTAVGDVPGSHPLWTEAQRDSHCLVMTKHGDYVVRGLSDHA